ncbi:hypothetical protein [Halocatena halophila]|uniref:hypothetical protein n=1 Tax=Halocatena halophila TaxID=2814576 RepID=UPI002ED01CB3
MQITGVSGFDFDVLSIGVETAGLSVGSSSIPSAVGDGYAVGTTMNGELFMEDFDWGLQ